jgi:hypothetical protein
MKSLETMEREAAVPHLHPQRRPDVQIPTDDVFEARRN